MQKEKITPTFQSERLILFYFLLTCEVLSSNSGKLINFKWNSEQQVQMQIDTWKFLWGEKFFLYDSLISKVGVSYR